MLVKLVVPVAQIFVLAFGCVVIVIGVLTVNAAALLFAAGAQVPVATARY